MSKIREVSQQRPLQIERVYVEYFDREPFGSPERYIMGYRIFDPAEGNRVVHVLGTWEFSRDPRQLVADCMVLCQNKGIISYTYDIISTNRCALVSNETLVQFHEWAPLLDESFSQMPPMDGNIIPLEELQKHRN